MLPFHIAVSVTLFRYIHNGFIWQPFAYQRLPSYTNPENFAIDREIHSPKRDPAHLKHDWYFLSYRIPDLF